MKDIQWHTYNPLDIETYSDILVTDGEIVVSGFINEEHKFKPHSELYENTEIDIRLYQYYPEAPKLGNYFE